MSALTATYDSFSFIGRSDKAMGSDSSIVMKRLLAIRENRQVMFTFSLPKDLCAEAAETQEKCSLAGWDGYDAHPVTREELAAAIHFAELLPEGIVHPEIVPEPSGQLGFLWTKGLNMSFSVTASANGNLIYAGILGKKEISGQLPFNNEIPQEIILNLFEFYGKF